MGIWRDFLLFFVEMKFGGPFASYFMTPVYRVSQVRTRALNGFIVGQAKPGSGKQGSFFC